MKTIDDVIDEINGIVFPLLEDYGISNEGKMKIKQEIITLFDDLENLVIEDVPHRYQDRLLKKISEMRGER